MNIQIIGLKTLDENELATLNRITKTEIEKLDIEIPKAKLIINIKKYEKGGKRSKYSLHARLDNPSISFAVQSDDWEISRAVHKIFNKLINEIHHRFEDN